MARQPVGGCQTPQIAEIPTPVKLADPSVPPPPSNWVGVPPAAPPTDALLLSIATMK
jgi:hypothetical protein